MRSYKEILDENELYKHIIDRQTEILTQLLEYQGKIVEVIRRKRKKENENKNINECYKSNNI